MKTLFAVLACCAGLILSGCSATPPSYTQNDVTKLAQTLTALGPEVDPAEATRAAQIAFSYSKQLATEYGVTTSPIIHNVRVNEGDKERGLCVHYAEDMQRRLNQEGFKTLQMHRAIALPKTPFNIDHSTAIISRRGDDMYAGVILDPWRNGGDLFWSPTQDDTRYNWRPRMEVLEELHPEEFAAARAAGLLPQL
ncbi:putative periplasmic lipoprotein [Falsiruegeria mediterranea]|jgi:hypothetical protein|uniref:Lipoprotein n=1 Tax=Falsiruegeria mediterranea M17 TaxID=1200281 RepID=A0A2R8C4R8_9RHOB|nr:hypothetical protein [Falsiruegeria mediterranea]SPJ27419.1 hypothetical protein TRM7615_00906 [Falsiruegeria mediterranea M17]